MPSLAQLAFVSAPSATPSLTLNLMQPGLIKVKADSFDLGAPSFDGQPYSIGAEYGERTVSFTLQVTGTFANATAAMQLISRQLVTPNPSQQLPTMRNRKWLMFRWSTSSDPMFLRAFPSPPESVQWENAAVGVWEVQLSLVCDAFMVGPREDLSSVTITSNPATGTNRLRADLGTIKGDVETPAYIWRGPGGLSTVSRSTSLLGCETGAAVADPPVQQAESATLTNDTTSTADATASGGNKARVSFATAIGLVQRLGAMVLPIGQPSTYRIFARVASSNNTSTYYLRYTDFTDGEQVLYAPDTASQWEWLNLGLFQMPPGMALKENGLTGSSYGRDTTGSVASLSASRESGAGSLDIDYLVAVPTAGQLVLSTAVLGTSASVYTVFDGHADEIYAVLGAVPLSGSANYYTGWISNRAGVLPMLTPGATNRLWFVDVLGDAPAAGNLLTQSVTLNVSYWPRYLYARPESD